MSSLSRRNFIKGGLALGLSANVLSTLPVGTAVASAKAPLSGSERLVKGYCPFCQVRCTYHARLRGDELVEFLGDTGNRWTGGGMCPKGLSMIELIKSPYRLVKPLRKIDGKWQEISYNEALECIAAKLVAGRKTAGGKGGERVALTMPLWDCRESELAALMLMRLLGSSYTMPAGEVCISSASQVLGMLLGTSLSTTTVNEVPNADLLVLWGANLSETYPVYSRWLVKARSRGTRILYMDCRRTATSGLADRQFSPLPGTDGALLLGAVRYVLENGLYDRMAVESLGMGLETLEKGAAPWTVDKVTAATGMPADEVTAFYNEIGKSERTIMWMGGSLSRYSNGMQTIRTLLSLQALTSNLLGPGRGVLTMEGGKPEGEKEFVDAVCGESDAKSINFRRLLAIMKKGGLDVLFLNSSYRRYPDCNAVAKAMNEVSRQGLVVYRGHFPTEEMEVANLFIPATLGPESSGSHYGAEKHVVWRDQILTAPGACVPDWMFYRDLGKLVFPKDYPVFSEPGELVERFRSTVPGWKGMTLERMKASPDGVLWPVAEEGGAERTGSLFVDTYLTEDGKFPYALSLLGDYGWEPPKGSPRGSEKTAAYPLILIQGKVATQWQQTLTNMAESLAQFSKGRYVQVHPETAVAFGLVNGDSVALTTELGSIPAVVSVTTDILPGVVFTPSHFMGSSPHAATRSTAINAILPNAWDRVSAQFNGGSCTLKKI